MEALTSTRLRLWGTLPHTPPRAWLYFSGHPLPYPATCCSPSGSGALKPLQVGPSGFGLHPEPPKCLSGLAVCQAQGDHQPREPPSPSRPRLCCTAYLSTLCPFPGRVLSPRPGWCAGCSGSQWGSRFTAPCHTLAGRHSSPAEPQSRPLPLGAPLGLPAPHAPPPELGRQRADFLSGTDRRPAACVHLPSPLCQTPPPRCLLTSVSLSVSVCPSSCVFRRGCSKFNSQ